MEERGARVKLVNCGEFVEYMALVKRQENRRNALGARINTAAQQRFAPWLITVEVGVCWSSGPSLCQTSRNEPASVRTHEERKLGGRSVGCGPGWPVRSGPEPGENRVCRATRS
jgi:hypothetical protein